MDTGKRKRVKKDDDVISNASPTECFGCESKASRAEKKKKTRMDQKGLVVELDKLLPKIVKPPEPAKCVGARALGSTGRSLLNILEDAAKLVREIRTKEGTLSGAWAGPSEEEEGAEIRQHPIPSITDVMMKEGLRSSQSLLVFETDLCDWRIRSMSNGMQEFFKLAPWGSCLGQSLIHLVHTEDKHILRNISVKSLSESQGISVGDNFTIKLMHFTTRNRKALKQKLKIFEYITCSFTMVHDQKTEFGRLALFVGNFPALPSQDQYVNFEQPNTSDDNTLLLDQDLFGIYHLNPRMSSCNPAEIREAMRSALNFLTKKSVDVRSGLVDEDMLLVQKLQERIGSKSMMSSILTSITSVAYRLIQIHINYDETDEGVPRFRFHYRLKFPQILGGFETKWRLFTEAPIDGTEVKMQNVGFVSSFPLFFGESSASKIMAVGYQVYQDGEETRRLFQTRQVTAFPGGLLFGGDVVISPSVEPFRYLLQFDKIAGPDKSLISDPGEVFTLLP
mmetsp:Transcript_31484/g.70832  ORF Transcript_31484/g.70832 Transcript_31484/m.70832 type:complete len:507 (-) Transcript_31484:2627-4147(-)